jgi:hypothetical protein
MSDELKDISDLIPDRYIISKDGIGTAVINEFYSYLSNIEKEIEPDKIEEYCRLLEMKDISFEIRKNILARLSIIGTVRAFRILEKYMTVSDIEIENWVKISLVECQRRLEEGLVEEDTGIISSGLGGVLNRLRYVYVLKTYFDISSISNDITEKIRKIAASLKSEIEEIKYASSNIQVKVLIPMDIAIGSLIENTIIKINDGKKFVYENYMVVNTHVPSDEEIVNFIDEQNNI